MSSDGNKTQQRKVAQKKVNQKINSYNPNISRVCRICGIKKKNKDFYSSVSKTYYGGKAFRIRNECKECIKKNVKKNFYENYHHNKKKNRDAYQKKHKFKNIKTEYGLTKKEYLQLVKDNPYCFICDKKIIKPQIDHCHKTGKVRSILCFRCNLGLGNFDDNINKLENAIKYLKKYGSESVIKSQ